MKLKGASNVANSIACPPREPALIGWQVEIATVHLPGPKHFITTFFVFDYDAISTRLVPEANSCFLAHVLNLGPLMGLIGPLDITSQWREHQGKTKFFEHTAWMIRSRCLPAGGLRGTSGPSRSQGLRALIFSLIPEQERSPTTTGRAGNEWASPGLLVQSSKFQASARPTGRR